MVPKSELTFVLPYLEKISLDIRTKLRRTVERDLLYYKLKLICRSIFRSTKFKLTTLFRFKDSLKKTIRSGKIYRHTCSNCMVTTNTTNLL